MPARGHQGVAHAKAHLTLMHIPFSSANAILDDLTAGKKRIVVFNKTDLSDPQANAVGPYTAAWPF